MQTLKKCERDYEAERDLLKISNNAIKQKLVVLRKEMDVKRELAKNSQQNCVNSKASQPLDDTNSRKPVAKLRSVESQASPVSVATQTSFTSGEESDTECSGASGGKIPKVEGDKIDLVSSGEVDHSDAVKKEACVDDEDEDVDVEGEITDDNTEDVDGLIKDEEAKSTKSAEPKATPGRSTKRKAAAGDDGNKLEAKKSNIQCCARVSC